MKAIELRLVIYVRDPDALREYAEERHLACWGQGLEAAYPGCGLGRCLFEALVGSSEGNACPLDMGFEVGDWSASHDGEVEEG
jgi:hypothetical protein